MGGCTGSGIMVYDMGRLSYYRSAAMEILRRYDGEDSIGVFGGSKEDREQLATSLRVCSAEKGLAVEVLSDESSSNLPLFDCMWVDSSRFRSLVRLEK